MSNLRTTQELLAVKRELIHGHRRAQTEPLPWAGHSAREAVDVFVPSWEATNMMFNRYRYEQRGGGFRLPWRGIKRLWGDIGLDYSLTHSVRTQVARFPALYSSELVLRLITPDAVLIRSGSKPRPFRVHRLRGDGMVEMASENNQCLWPLETMVYWACTGQLVFT